MGCLPVEVFDMSNILEDGYFVTGWNLNAGGDPNTVELEPLIGKTTPRAPPSWRSTLYRITNDGWVFSSAQERFAWLPHHWRPQLRDVAWRGRSWGACFK